MQQSSRRKRSIRAAAVDHLQPRRDYQAAAQAMRCFSQKTTGTTGAEQQHAEFLKQMQELQAERDTLFGFNDSDRNAWASVSKDHQFDRSFLDEINQARRDHHDSSADTMLSDTRSAESSDIEATTLSAETKKNNDNNVGYAGLSHLSTDGTSVRMVNVGDKQVTSRVAVAQSQVLLPDIVIQAFRRRRPPPDNALYDDLVGPKGPIFATAKVAGIMAAKYVFFFLPTALSKCKKRRVMCIELTVHHSDLPLLFPFFFLSNTFLCLQKDE
jgi:MoaC family